MVQPDKRAEYADIYRWVRACFLKTGKAPNKLELLHVSGNDSSLVQVWDSFRDTEGPEPIADEIIDAAIEDAEIYKGIQIYTILYYENSKGPKGRKPFRIDGGQTSSGLHEESEPPTEKGYTSQMMRHNEASHKLNMHALNQQLANALRANERKDDIIERFANKFFDTLIAFEQLMDRKEERDVRNQERKQEMELRGKLFGRIEQVLPPLMGKILPASPAVHKMQAEAFFSTLTEEQLNKILSVLDGEQAKLLSKALIKQDIRILHTLFSGLTDEQNMQIGSTLTANQFASIKELFDTMSQQQTQNGAQNHV